MNESEYNDDLPPSKSQLKRDAASLQDAGERLMSFKKTDLDRLPLTSDLIKAIDEAKRIHSHEARRRHAQFVGRLMRDTDTDRLLDAMTQLHNPIRQKRLQDWQERLLVCQQPKEAEPLTQQLMEWYPHGDRQHLRNLCRNVLMARSQREEPSKDEIERFKRERRKLSSHLNELEKQTPL